LRKTWERVGEATSAIDLRAAFMRTFERRRELERPLLFTISALFVLSGFYSLGPDEIGVIERFGRRVLPNRQPGLHYKLPWPIERLTRIQAARTRVVEIGFRSNSPAPDSEPLAYEWNVQHRSGRFQRRPEESLLLAGDQNMMEVNASVHYRLKQPDEFLFRQLDGDATVRAAAESVLQQVATSSQLDDMLTAGRRVIELRARRELQEALDRYSAGVEVLGVRLLDVHPSLEVVDAFRDVAGAFEEKSRLINEAEGYRNEQVALARGNSEARLLNAASYSLGRKNRAEGESSRFRLSEEAFRLSPGPTETRLYLEGMEQVLSGRRKVIVDASKGRRHLLLVDDGVEIGPATMLAGPRKPPEE
jgi:HflK protein